MSSSSRRVSSASRRSISSRAIARSSSSRVGRVAQLARAGELGAGRLQAPERLDDRLEPGQLLAQPADLGRVGRRPRAWQSSAWSVVVLAGDLGELGVEVGHAAAGGSVGRRRGADRAVEGAVAASQLHRVALEARAVGTASPSATSASSIETMATSIMSSVGCFVVIIWTSRPGYSRTLTSGFPRWRAPNLRIS